MVNFGALNHETPLFFIALKNVSERKEKEIIKFLISQPEIGWCTKALGTWDIAFGAFVKYPSDIFSLLSLILRKFPNRIRDYNIGLVSRVTDLRTGAPTIIEMLDKKDTKLSKNEKLLLKILDENCRISFLDMSKKTGMNYKTFRRTLDKLKDKKILEGFSCQVNHSPFGYEHNALLFKFRKRDEERVREFHNFLLSLKGVYYSVRMVGNYDLTVQFLLKEKLEMQKIISEIRSKFSDLVGTIEHLVYLEEYKLTYLPPNI